MTGGAREDAEQSHHQPDLTTGLEDAEKVTVAFDRYAAAGGRYLVCPICFESKSLQDAELIPGAQMGGTVPLWQWIGEENAVTFSY